MKQVTFALRHHQLTNTRAWTADSRWLVFDVRPSGASFTGETIERVNVDTGEVEILYRAGQGAYVGVVTVHPSIDKYVFIHGPENPDERWHYDFHHRRGVVSWQGETHNLDAMDITPPYTPGALRGGSTTPSPAPGSDEINRAYEEGWVGDRALAFIGDTRAINGDKVPELFIVALPQSEQDWKQSGDAPLAGTQATMPAPPAGVVQRRLTFTHERHYPGLVTTPRHWVRANPQATEIAFLMRDEAGVVQMWLISPQGDGLRQLTHNRSDIQSAFNWHPSGKWLGFVLENRIALCDARSGEILFLTDAHENPPSADAVVFSPDGKRLAWMEEVDGYRQLWVTATAR